MDDLDRREARLRFQRLLINRELAMIGMTRAFRKAAAQFERFAMTFQAFEIERADEGEFDNRLRDWLRG